MSSCNKVKNPCKICLGPVSQKNGLQCQGVCESWVHYTCLNYTPGKISDIKSGIIKVNCPCPDCKTTQLKEYRTDEGFSCNNQKCPAHQPPKCENQMCPVNSQFPSVPDMAQTPPCPLGQCGTDCKVHLSSRIPQPFPMQAPGPDETCGHNPIPMNPPTYLPAPKSTCGASNCPGPGRPNKCPPPPRPPKCPGPARPHKCPGPVVEYNSCPTSSSSDGPPPCRAGDTNVYSVTSLSGVEQMCNTVGQLTTQINNLMSQMKQVVARGPGCYPRDYDKSCSQKGPKSKCPKPCYCPGNPCKRS